MGHLAGMQTLPMVQCTLSQNDSNFRSEQVSLQTKWLILFYRKILANKALEEKLEAEVTQVDQKVVLELDQLVSDQQATLQVRIVPAVVLFWPAVYSFSGSRFLVVLLWEVPLLVMSL